MAEQEFALMEVGKKGGPPVKHYIACNHEEWEAIKKGFKSKYGLEVTSPTQLKDLLLRAAHGDLKIVASKQAK